MSNFRVDVKNVDCYYGSVQALFDINLQVEQQQVMALIGPSGCGKSTFLRTLNKMNELIPDTRVEGQIFIDGEDILTSKMEITALRKKIGMVFQKSNPFPKSIYENIAFGPRIHGVTRKSDLDEIVESSLTGAALWDEVKDRLQKNALDLSGGQQQRLCIARSLAIEPEILLMDEPASALDPKSTAKIEELISVLKKKYTIVIVTHNMQQAARVSDKTAFFFEGKLIEVDETQTIFTNPNNKQTEDYITGRFG
jgi:phosphate transport system ATP-binding protein